MVNKERHAPWFMASSTGKVYGRNLVMPVNKVVVHRKNGEVMKGITMDFTPTGPAFHLEVGGVSGTAMHEVLLESAKAIFFVKDFTGRLWYKDVKEFAAEPRAGSRVKATFQDGEVIYGYSHALNFDYPGFFLFPADSNSNNQRVYVIYASLESLEVHDSPVDLRGLVHK
jgi:hypothetical protein